MTSTADHSHLSVVQGETLQNDERAWLTELRADLARMIAPKGTTVDNLVKSVGPPEAIMTYMPVRLSLQRRELLQKLHGMASVRFAVTENGESGLPAQLAILSAGTQLRDSVLLYAVAELMRPEAVDRDTTIEIGSRPMKKLTGAQILSFAFARAAQTDPTDVLGDGNPAVAHGVLQLLDEASQAVRSVDVTSRRSRIRSAEAL